MFTRAISQEEKRSREKLASISPIYYYHYQYYYPRRGYCQVSLLLLPFGTLLRMRQQLRPLLIFPIVLFRVLRKHISKQGETEYTVLARVYSLVKAR